MSDAYAEAARILAEAEEVALACHINPDPDAAGSMLGLARYLAERGKAVVASWGNEPFTRPRFIEALPGSELIIEPKSFPRKPAVLVTLDTASSDRLGTLVGVLPGAGTVICIDHHVTNEGFGTIDLIEPHASSTAEVVYRLIQAMGGGLSPDSATCLYAGIVTDTGRFQYEATTPETLRVAADLREAAFDHARLAQALFEDSSLASLKLLAKALDRIVHVPEASLVWTYLTQADLDGGSASMQETDDMIDVIRTAREADVAAIAKQQRDGGFKMSLRSRGGHDVGSVAAALGGGGHRLAAGYTSKAGLEETMAELVRQLATKRVEPGS
jgi:phosphoesterase RecJ-like protein